MHVRSGSEAGPTDHYAGPCERFSFGRKSKACGGLNSYDLAGGGQRWKRLRELVDRPEAKLVEYDFQTREAVINYIRSRGTITPTVGDWWTARRGSKPDRTPETK
jgi:hypothetical protein